MSHAHFKGKKILLLGSGGLRISQAGEFDYSGSQAIKAFKEEGLNVVLVNPNIATVQTDESMADDVYLQPLNLPTVTRIIEQEKPDAIALSFGGQTALNLGLELEAQGILAKHNIIVLGSSVDTIRLAEDRDLFKKMLASIDVDTPKSIAVTTVEDAVTAAHQIGFPIMMRSGFSLGGLGSGRIDNEQDLVRHAKETLQATPQLLIEEYLVGWSEVEYEIVRDRCGNAVTVCNMENFDPMGIHTGESIVVSPSQTLNNEEYHRLREIGIKVANQLNIVGECNIQYAFNPKNGEYRVIEVNPRLSRSSALASKATGYPLAFVAAKLALGYQLYEIKNSVTQKTCAFFEPALDYIVVKIPRWDTHKLKAADRRIGTEMKSVGEVMAIGRSFAEALQKAVGMLNTGVADLTDYRQPIAQLEQEISQATDRRLFAIYQYLLGGASVTQVAKLSGINPWFLHHIQDIAQCENQLTQQSLDRDLLHQAKKLGFADSSIARTQNCATKDIRELRQQHRIKPWVKQVDTLAGEFDAQTNYLYLTYHGSCHDIPPSDRSPVVVLGSGPYSIGSSVEFDWCGVNTARTLRELNEYAIMINSNPETVSTDYDESDRLYFEPLTFERVQDIAEFEKPKGIIVSVGGQIANNLALPLFQSGFAILGTHPTNIDMAENRQQFSSLLTNLGVDQPAWTSATSLDNVHRFINEVGYPVLVRPSYVLSGAAMNVVYNEKELSGYLQDASFISPDNPVVISKFINDAKELEIDGVAKEGDIVIQAISEHIENAGVHSGDATLVLPPQRLYLETIRRTKKITAQIIKALDISGPFNIQFIAKNNEIKVIECNVRAARSFPFVSKVTNHNLIAIATRVMMDEYDPQTYETLELDYVGVKTPQFSYRRLKGANPVANVEMASTGEVACLGDDLLEAFFQSWQASDLYIANKKLFVSIGGRERKFKFLEPLRKLEECGWDIYTTAGTHEFLAKNGVGSSFVYKAREQAEPNTSRIIADRKVDVIINIPSNQDTSNKQKTDGYHIRRLAIDHQIPLLTNMQTSLLLLQCLAELPERKLAIKSWRDFMVGRVPASGTLSFWFDHHQPSTTE